jgi:hypothetical protein
MLQLNGFHISDPIPFYWLNQTIKTIFYFQTNIKNKI